LFLCCGLIIAFFILGGYAKQFACQSVLPDSYIYNQLECITTDSIGNTRSVFGLDVSRSNEKNSEKEIVQTVEKASQAVVGIGINNDESGTNNIVGTGFLVNQDGMIVTNMHVVAQVDASYVISFKGEDIVKIDQSDIVRDPVNDIANVT
jgi:S1-C subfamily serine protease